jgi:FkbM family methyltransferase
MLSRLFGQIGVYRHIVGHPLNAGHRWAATRRWLGWHLGSRLVPGAVAVPFVNDTLLLIDPGMTGATLNVYCGLAELSDMGFVLHALRPENLFLDVGANVGVYSVMASGAVGASSIAIEPAPETVKKLRRNILMNGLSASVEILNVAVGQGVQTVRLTTGGDTTNHVIAEGEHANSCEVPMVSLDFALAGRVPDLIKIDVEGFELPILRGSSRILADPAVQGIVIELNGSGDRYGYSDRDAVQMLVANGFISVTYDPLGRVLGERDPLAKEGNNAIFVRDVEAMQRRVRDAAAFRLGNGRTI